MRRATSFLLACALPGVAVGALLAAPSAAAKPPAGACTDPEPARPVVHKLPWAQQYLDPQRAWQFSTGKGVTVAVVDSGVDADHPQLRRPGKVLRGRDFFLVGDLPGNYDCVSHGTGVASIIAADKVPGVGFEGIAPDARILPVRISDREVTDDGSTRVIDPHVLAKGIRYAADQHAKVINLSLSGIDDHREVRSAIRYAQSKDALVVAAVGNSQQDETADLPSYPAAYPGVLGVGSIDISGARSSGSQIGSYVDLVAPGDSVLAATRKAGHAYVKGTSFATPFVSATAALVRSAWPSLSAQEVAKRLLATATPARGGTGSKAYGAGVVDPYRAVTESVGGSPAPLPAATHPVPDPHRVAEQAWWRVTDLRARTLAGVSVGGAVLAFSLGTAVRVGRRRRWRPTRTAVSARPDGTRKQPPPERLFEQDRRSEEPVTASSIVLPPELRDG